jgi:hypothetical protein
MKFPTRFYTGIRKTTIPNPAWLHSCDGKTFEGLCSEYDFSRQKDNYDQLRLILQRNGTDFLYVAAAKFEGDLHTNHRFVATAADGSLVWNKYVAYVAQGAQNHVYVGGMRIKTSMFLHQQPHRQDALLTGSRSKIELAFKDSPGQLKYIDETDTLWN